MTEHDSGNFFCKCEECEGRMTQELKCPYCGEEISDSWELIIDDGGYEEYECGECEKTFGYTCDHSVTFTSRRIETK